MSRENMEKRRVGRMLRRIDKVLNRKFESHWLWDELQNYPDETAMRWLILSLLAQNKRVSDTHLQYRLTRNELVFYYKCLHNPEALAAFVTKARDSDCSADAFSAITDKDALRNIAGKDCTDQILQDRFIKRKSPAAPDARLFELAMESSDNLVKDWAVANLGQSYLKALAGAEQDSLRRCAILRRIEDTAWLARQYNTDDEPLIRSAIIEKISDPRTLKKFRRLESVPELKDAIDRRIRISAAKET